VPEFKRTACDKACVGSNEDKLQDVLKHLTKMGQECNKTGQKLATRGWDTPSLLKTKIKSFSSIDTSKLADMSWLAWIAWLQDAVYVTTWHHATGIWLDHDQDVV